MSSGWTGEAVDAHLRRMGKARVKLEASAKQPTSKYRNRKVLVTFQQPEIVAGHTRLCHEFDSQKEADQYQQLCLMRQSGQLHSFVLQQPYALIALNPMTKLAEIVGEWFADFVVTTFDVQRSEWITRVMDVKTPGTRTQTYLLKKKIVEACHGIRITEVS